MRILPIVPVLLILPALGCEEPEVAPPSQSALKLTDFELEGMVHEAYHYPSWQNGIRYVYDDFAPDSAGCDYVWVESITFIPRNWSADSIHLIVQDNDFWFWVHPRYTGRDSTGADIYLYRWPFDWDLSYWFPPLPPLYYNPCGHMFSDYVWWEFRVWWGSDRVPDSIWHNYEWQWADYNLWFDQDVFYPRSTVIP